jgi:uncharacterized delta-60 repeat protein
MRPRSTAASAGLDDAFADFGVDIHSNVDDPISTIAHLPRADGGSIAVLSYAGANCPVGRVCLGVARYSENGTHLGNSLVPAAISFTFVAGAAIDAQGRIVVAGTIQLGATDHDFMLTRFFPDANPDTSFGSNGQAFVAFDQGGGNYDAAHALTIDSAGRIVVVGETERSGAMDSDFAVARLLPNGTQDPAFGINSSGKRVVPFNLTATNPTDVATAVGIDEDGFILVGGTVRDFNRGVLRMGLTRLTPAGLYDTTWCTTSCLYNEYPAIHSGRRTIYFGTDAENRTHSLAHLAVNDQGVAITVGRMRHNGIFSGFAQRLGADGTWVAELELDGGETATGNSVTMGAVHWLEPGTRDGDIIVTGVSGVGEDLFFAQRLSEDLAPRADWGSAGASNSVFAFSATGGFTGDPAIDIPAMSSIDRRGRVLMAGAVKTPLSSSPYNAMVARLTNPLLIFSDGLEGSAN